MTKNQCYAFRSLLEFFPNRQDDIMFAIRKWIETTDPVYAQIQLDLASMWLQRNRLIPE